VPAAGPIEGKADQLVRLGPTDVVTPRQIVEAVEALPTRPWPAGSARTVHDGRMQLTLPASAIDGLDEAEAVSHFADRGLDVGPRPGPATPKRSRSATYAAICTRPRSRRP
jgi:hypothetical protein